MQLAYMSRSGAIAKYLRHVYGRFGIAIDLPESKYSGEISQDE